MYPHHAQSIQNVIDYFQRDPEVIAVLLAGSIAHGFQTPASDVDILILVSDEEYKRRVACSNCLACQGSKQLLCFRVENVSLLG